MHFAMTGKKRLKEIIAEDINKGEMRMRKIEKNYWMDGMMGLIVGDALGMPVQFYTRDEVKKNPIVGMRGYGTYNMPPGTWSDDSSMALATLASIREKGGIDLTDIMERFVNWLVSGGYTPDGEPFDVGCTCHEAIMNYMRGAGVQDCGKRGEYANGNGALMRIMPVCLYAYEKEKRGEITEDEALTMVHEVSALTHNHLRSKMACGIYYFMVKAILEGKNADDMEGSLVGTDLAPGCERTLCVCLQEGMDQATEYYHKDLSNYVEFAHYARMTSLSDFALLPEDEIKSSGYVVASLEAAVWSLITSDSLEEGLLKAVNLGEDTDTVGAIAGGLAGLYYGYESIPCQWREAIVRREWIEKLISDSVTKIEMR